MGVRSPRLFGVFLVVVTTALSASGAVACPLHRAGLLPEWFPLPGFEGGFPQELNATLGTMQEGLGVLASGVTSIPVNRPPREVGRWQAPVRWPVMGIHAAVLPTGEVLHFSYPGDAFQLGGSASPARVWDPGSGTFQNVTWRLDLFCGGQSFLPDGRLLVTGGNAPTAFCDTRGRVNTHVFDPQTGTWTETQPMARARWYPTNVTQADGSVLIFGGLDSSCESNPLVERYTADGRIERLPVERVIHLYPRLHLLTDGRIAHMGPEPHASIFDPVAIAWQIRVAANASGDSRFEGTSFAVPGEPDRIVICGGFDGYDQFPTASCESVDFRESPLRFQPAAPLNVPRAHADSVVLPDGTVLFVGGGQSGLYDDPVLNAELYDPAANAWTLLPPQQFGRMYHATAVLLPDGRVLSTGQDDDEAGGRSAEWTEIYEPPYLFRGDRPQIRQAPQAISWGGRFPVVPGTADDIRRVTLIRLSAVTHSVNATQRYVPLEFERVGEALQVRGPRDGHHAPPGPYMLFVLDGNGVPSEARMVRVAETRQVPGWVEFASDRFEAGETDGSATLRLERTGGSAGPVTVRVIPVSGSATEGADFTSEATLRWRNGQTGIRSLTVPILDDFENEGDETVRWRVEIIAGAAEPGARSEAELILIDNDLGSPGSLSFSQAVYETGEEAASATITVHRVGGDLGPATVSYRTEDLSAHAGEDYQPAGGQLAWSPGDQEPKTFTVPLVGDGEGEGVAERSELVRLVLADATGAALGENPTAVLRLDDDDRGGGPCEPGEDRLCLLDNRFQVEVDWRDLDSRSGHVGTGGALPGEQAGAEGDASGFFWFFQPDTLELVVKVLDARSVNGSHWVFYGALTDVEYWITVTDTEEGEIRTYHNPPANLCGLGDTEAFPRAGQPLGPAPTEAAELPVPEVQTGMPEPPCTPGDDRICLLDGRLRVEVAWHDPRSGNRGVGTAVPSNDGTGLFWFFDRSNLELVVKGLDGRPVNGRLWFFYGALTDVEYTITVTDTTTGARRLYTNPAGNLCGRGDTVAF